MSSADRDENAPQPLVEGVDYYLEHGFLVFTSHYLLKRGYCCENGCRHCPYGFDKSSDDSAANRSSGSPNIR
jgi:hypothetical protein